MLEKVAFLIFRGSLASCGSKGPCEGFDPQQSHAIVYIQHTRTHNRMKKGMGLASPIQTVQCKRGQGLESGFDTKIFHFRPGDSVLG